MPPPPPPKAVLAYTRATKCPAVFARPRCTGWQTGIFGVGCRPREGERCLSLPSRWVWGRLAYRPAGLDLSAV